MLDETQHLHERAVTPEESFLQALRGLSRDATTETLKEAVARMPAVGLEDDEGDVDELEGTTELIETTESDEEPTEEVEEKTASTSGLFQRPDTHPLILDILLLRRYGPEWFYWEPETLAVALPRDFSTSEVSELNLHKLQAVRTLHLATSPWTEWEVFTWCCMALTGVLPDFDVMQAPTAAQSLVAIDLFNRVRQDVEWSEEVKAFLAIAWKLDGILCTIPPADFITIDTHDLVVDCAEVMRRWPQAVAGTSPTRATVEDEQLRRLLSIHRELEDSRSRFLRQSAVLR